MKLKNSRYFFKKIHFYISTRRVSFPFNYGKVIFQQSRRLKSQKCCLPWTVVTQWDIKICKFISGQKISYLDHWWWRDIGNNWRHIVLEFEAQVVMKTEEKSKSQQTPGFQKRFLNHATNLNEEFHEPRNPFEDAHEKKACADKYIKCHRSIPH